MNGALTPATSAFLTLSGLSGLSGPVGMGTTGSFGLMPTTGFSSLGMSASAIPGGFTTIQASAVGNSQTAAAATTVLSASELNMVLDDLRRLNTDGLRGRDVELSEAVLEHINIVPKSSPGNAGMLKNFSRDWPEVLKASEFQGERERIEALLPHAGRPSQDGPRKCYRSAKPDRGQRGHGGAVGRTNSGGAGLQIHSCQALSRGFAKQYPHLAAA
jgi:hypothetical protein